MPELFGILRENRELKPALRQRDIEKQRMDAELKHKEAELEQRDAESQRVAVEMEQKNAVILELRQQLSELQRELDDKDTKCNTQLHKKEDFIDVVVGEATHFQDRAVKADQLVATLFPLVDESRVAMAKQSEQERRKVNLILWGTLPVKFRLTLTKRIVTIKSGKIILCRRLASKSPNCLKFPKVRVIC